MSQCTVCLKVAEFVTHELSDISWVAYATKNMIYTGHEGRFPMNGIHVDNEWKGQNVL